VTRRANDRGALLAGVHPELLPGGRPVQQADDVERVWGPVMHREPGRDTIGILRACAEREVDVLFLIGVDPLRDVPDADLVRRALDNVPVKVVQSLELGSLEPFADAFLPASAFLEKDGHVSTWEGRGQRLRAIRGRDGISLADWEIFASLALACGGDLGFETLDELREEMGAVWAPMGRADDGAIVDAAAADPPDGAPPPFGADPSGASVEGLAPQPDHERARGDEGATAAVDRAPEGLGATHDAAPDDDGGAGELRLFTYPLLVDEGRLSERADELKAALGEEAFVEVHPDDAATLGLEHGGAATVRTAAGEAELPVRVTAHVARGAAFVPFNQPGLAANELLSGEMVARATISPSAAADDGGTAEETVTAAATATGGGDA
jgi:predicted molibdopterin-dependent oxidoreductase YjgC